MPAKHIAQCPPWAFSKPGGPNKQRWKTSDTHHSTVLPPTHVSSEVVAVINIVIISLISKHCKRCAKYRCIGVSKTLIKWIVTRTYKIRVKINCRDKTRKQVNNSSSKCQQQMKNGFTHKRFRPIGFWQPRKAGLNKHTGKSCIHKITSMEMI